MTPRAGDPGRQADLGAALAALAWARVAQEAKAVTAALAAPAPAAVLVQRLSTPFLPQISPSSFTVLAT